MYESHRKKTLVRKSQMSVEIKSSVLKSSSGNKGIKVLKKKVLSLGKMRSILRSFLEKDFFLCTCIFNIVRGTIISKVINILCSHVHFLLYKDFFSWDFLYEIILEPEKSLSRTLFQEPYFSRTVFLQDFSSAKI